MVEEAVERDEEQVRGPVEEVVGNPEQVKEIQGPLLVEGRGRSRPGAAPVCRLRRRVDRPRSAAYTA